MIRLSVILIALGLAVLPHSSAFGEDAPDRRRSAPPKTFRDGLSAFYGGRFEAAAAQMYDFIATNEDTVENWAWAQYFLGISLARIGLQQAASEYLFNVANDRTRPEILPDALAEIEKLMSGPHDETLLDDRLIIDSDFGYLPPTAAGFVRYHQGLADLRSNKTEWAQRLFSAIPKRTAYAARATYALGVENLRRGRDGEAIKGFRKALNHAYATREVRNLARLALARALYDRERYDAADAMYQKVEVPEFTTSEGQVILERAWTAYWRDAHRESMGLLYALEAPSYEELYAPEKYLLRALIFKKLCHYIPAKRAIRRFRLTYGPTLDNIKRRIDLREDESLRRAALNEDPTLKRLFDHRRALAKELRALDNIGADWRKVGLNQSLRKIYELAAQKADLKIDNRLAVVTRIAAEKLVEFEEQMYLLDYEIGLAIYRRLKEERARRGTETSIEIPIAGPEAIYPFVGEFWNDEIANFDFLIQNRCFDVGGDE